MVSKSVEVFTDATDAALPKHVKKFPAVLRRRWISAHNYHIMDNHDPESAVRYADENTYLTLSEAMQSGFKEVQLPTPEATSSDGFMQKFLSYIKSLSGPPATSNSRVTGEGRGPFLIYKQNDGRVRVFMVYSNMFKDSQDEIVSSAAHKEYAEFVEKAGVSAYPDIHLWHGGPGSKWGKIDFVDYVDGFAIASGLVDVGKEHIAEALASQEVRVSYGFFGLKAADTYALYRAFEISPLPLDAEANKWTAYAGVDISSKEFSMPFSDKKKAWLKSTAGVDDATISAWEASLKQASESLIARGISFKEEDVVGENAAGAVILNIAALTKALAELAASVSKEIGELKTTVKSLEEAGVKSIEAKVEESILAKIAASGGPNGGFRASAAPSTVVTGKEAEAAKLDTADFFGSIVLGPALGSIAAQGPPPPVASGSGIS